MEEKGLGKGPWSSAIVRVSLEFTSSEPKYICAFGQPNKALVFSVPVTHESLGLKVIPFNVRNEVLRPCIDEAEE
jgi:hypothetical protein